MKGKYITTQIMLVCSGKTARSKKDIHTQLAETIAERKQLMRESEHKQANARIIAYLNFIQAA